MDGLDHQPWTTVANLRSWTKWKRESKSWSFWKKGEGKKLENGMVRESWMVCAFCPRDERLFRPVARYADKRGQCAQREEGKKGDQ